MKSGREGERKETVRGPEKEEREEEEGREGR